MTGDEVPTRTAETHTSSSPADVTGPAPGRAATGRPPTSRPTIGRSRHRRQAVSSLGVALLLITVATLSACSSDFTSAAGALTPANADLVSLSGARATTTAIEDGRIELRLTTTDRFVVYRRVDDGEIQADAHTLADIDAVWEAAGFTVTAPRMTIDLRRHDGDFSMAALSAPVIEAGVMTITGFPVGGLPPQQFEDWAMFVVPSTDDTATSAPATGAITADSPPVTELTMEAYLAAMQSVPPRPVLARTSIGSTPVGTRPSDFEVQTSLQLPTGATYDLDVNTPGSADPRRLTARLAVDEDEVALTDESDPGVIRITDLGSVGDTRTVTIAAGPFDVGATAAVTTQIRRVEPAGAARPWEEVLPCPPGVSSFSWRVPGESPVRQGPCPTPFAWVSSVPITPSLRPDPAAVAAAAGFGSPATLETHIGRLVTAVAGAPATSRGLVVQLEVGMLAPTSEAGPPVFIPILLASVDPLSMDEAAAQAAAHIRLFEEQQLPGADGDLSFSLTLTSSVAPGVLSSVRQVVLPAANVAG